ncbi:MAG: MBG domain-containing protein, partial [Clostridia bacterium]|nr:MBG domain-containing protein [Clostridia bacterium]
MKSGIKKTLIFIILTLVSALAFSLSACGTKEEKKPKINEITGVTFENGTFTYDGTEKEIVITGELPDGVTVIYQDNKRTLAGVSEAVATLSGEGYETKTLNAILRVNKATFDMSNAKWDYETPFTYDGTEKTVSVTGLPDGVTVKGYKGNLNKATDAGNYTTQVNFEYDDENYEEPIIGICSWKIQKATFDTSNLKWDYESAFTFDGSEKVVSVVGIPEGVTLRKIEGDKATNAGNYTASVKFTYDTLNYNAVTLDDCEWEIEKADLSTYGIAWDYETPFT